MLRFRPEGLRGPEFGVTLNTGYQLTLSQEVRSPLFRSNHRNISGTVSRLDAGCLAKARYFFNPDSRLGLSDSGNLVQTSGNLGFRNYLQDAVANDGGSASIGRNQSAQACLTFRPRARGRLASSSVPPKPIGLLRPACSADRSNVRPRSQYRSTDHAVLLVTSSMDAH